MEINKEDIPYQKAKEAHGWTSMTPEVRADQEQAAYLEHMTAFYSGLMAKAKTEPEREYLEAEAVKYKAGYISHKLAYLAARSRCASTMVTGGSNFNVGRNEKANNSAENKYSEWTEWQKRAEAAILKVLNEMRTAAAGGPLVIMRQELEAAEREHENLKAVRAAFRKETNPDKRVTIVKEITGYEGKELSAFVSRNYIDGEGVPVFRLTNGLARIKAMRQRVAEMEKRGNTPTSEKTFEGGRVVDNAEADRIQIFFNERPGPELYAKLKGRGFRWSPSAGAWQRYRTNDTRYAVKFILGVVI